MQNQRYHFANIPALNFKLLKWITYMFENMLYELLDLVKISLLYHFV